MLEVICWKWKPLRGYRSQFGPEQVNTLKRMVARHYPHPHRFTCITDEAAGIDADVRVIPLWDDYAAVPSPHGGLNPSCYRRLKMFSREARTLIGERFVSLDLDCVITADLSPLWNRPEDFVIWGDTAKGTPYNGSMVLMTAGARAQVWEQFDPNTSPVLTRKAGYIGSDQAWIGLCLGPGEKKWTAADGVYSYRNEIERRGGLLPKNARVVIFHGHVDPWQATTKARHNWVRNHYQ